MSYYVVMSFNCFLYNGNLNMVRVTKRKVSTQIIQIIIRKCCYFNDVFGLDELVSQIFKSPSMLNTCLYFIISFGVVLEFGWHFWNGTFDLVSLKVLFTKGRQNGPELRPNIPDLNPNAGSGGLRSGIWVGRPLRPQLFTE